MINDDLISRSALLEEFKEPGFLMSAIIRHTIGKAPAIDAEPVRHGRWIRPAFDPAWVKCSECGCYWEGGIVENCNMYYCPNCGAKMDAEVEG